MRHRCVRGMLVRAERAERMIADFVAVASEEREIDYWPRGRCLGDIWPRVGFGLISAQDTRSLWDKEE